MQTLRMNSFFLVQSQQKTPNKSAKNTVKIYQCQQKRKFTLAASGKALNSRLCEKKGAPAKEKEEEEVGEEEEGVGKKRSKSRRC